MALFKTIGEFTQIVRMDSGIELKELLPHIEDAEEDWIIPEISQEQYDLLHSDYQDSADPATQMVPALYALLLKIQKSLAQLAMPYYLAKDNIQKSGSGFQMKSNDQSKQAFQWMLDDANISYAQSGFRRLDAVLEYMELNKGNYAAWTDSDAYTIFKSFYVNSTRAFHKTYHISMSRRLYKNLLPAQIVIEDQHIAPAIGEEFHNELKAAIMTSSTTAEEGVIIAKIQKAVVYLTIAEGLPNLMVDITPRGILLIGTGTISTNARKADPIRDSILGKMTASAKINGANYLSEVVSYLNKMASETAYATYFASDLYEDPNADDAGERANGTTIVI